MNRRGVLGSLGALMLAPLVWATRGTDKQVCGSPGLLMPKVKTPRAILIKECTEYLEFELLTLDEFAIDEALNYAWLFNRVPNVMRMHSHTRDSLFYNWHGDRFYTVPTSPVYSVATRSFETYISPKNEKLYSPLDKFYYAGKSLTYMSDDSLPQRHLRLEIWDHVETFVNAKPIRNLVRRKV